MVERAAAIIVVQRLMFGVTECVIQVVLVMYSNTLYDLLMENLVQLPRGSIGVVVCHIRIVDLVRKSRLILFILRLYVLIYLSTFVLIENT